MRVASVDPRLLLPTGARVAAETVAGGVAGEPALLRIEGGRDAWEPLAGAGAAAAAVSFLRRVAAVTMAVGDVPPDVAAAVDLVAADRRDADRWEAGVARSPAAALAAALLLRSAPDDVWDGLVAESATYSMLQAGEAFRSWLRVACGRVRPPDDDGPRVRTARAGDVVTVVLTRPERHNAVDRRLRDELHEVLDELLDQPSVAVAVLGEGPSFCSGGDLGEFGTAPDPPAAHAVRLGRSLAWDFARLGPRMAVGLHGACLGAGIELAAFAARVVAADDARIGLPEAGLGLIPGAGGTVSVRRRAGRRRVLELLLAGDPVGAATARSWGLVDEVVARGDLERRVAESARELAAGLA